MLTIADVRDELAKQSLSLSHFRFLSLEFEHIRFLMCQPKALVEGTDSRVGVAQQERKSFSSRMFDFLNQAQQSAADVVLCPEYSMLWDVLEAALQSDLFPVEGKLWALACEGLEQERYEKLLVKAAAANVTVILDGSVWNSLGNFIDPLCYLFQARNAANEPVKILLMQPKTEQMGGTDYEYSRLKVGSKIYRFNNEGTNTNHLVGLICSDTLNPELTGIASSFHHRTILLHPQMNKRSEEPAFSKYRNDCCIQAPRNTEIVCLNWAAGTQLLEGGAIEEFIKEPRTTFFRSPKDIDDSDERIIENHQKGCYLTVLKEHTAAYSFSSDEHLYYFETTKPYVEGVATNAALRGPRMLSLYSWNDQAEQWQVNPGMAVDGVAAYWCGEEQVSERLNPLLAHPLKIERLIHLCTGHALTVGWQSWRKMQSFSLPGDETLKRLTICRSSHGEGYGFRSKCFQLFSRFTGLLAEPARYFSARLSTISHDNYELKIIEGHLPRSFANLHSGTASATAIYVGENIHSQDLEKAKKSLLKCLYDVGADQERVAIWYSHNGSIKDYMNDSKPKVGDDPKGSPVGIGVTK